MTACKDSLSGKKAVSATLAGVLAVGMVPAAAFAETAQADEAEGQGVELQEATEAQKVLDGGTVSEVKVGDEVAADVSNVTKKTTDNGAVTISKVVPFEGAKAVATTDTSIYTQVYYCAATSIDTDVVEFDGANWVKLDAAPTAAGTYLVALGDATAQSKVAEKAPHAQFTITAASLEGAFLATEKDSSYEQADLTYDFGTTKWSNLDIALDGDTKVCDVDGTNVKITKEGASTVAVDSALTVGTYNVNVQPTSGKYAGEKVSFQVTVSPVDLSSYGLYIADKAYNNNTIPSVADVLSKKTGRAAIATETQGQFKLELVSPTVYEENTSGTQTVKLSLSDEATAETKANVTGTATISFNRIVNPTAVTFKYGKTAVASGDTLTFDQAATKDTSSKFAGNFDISKLKGTYTPVGKTDAVDTDAVTVVSMKDSAGKDVTSMTKPGTYTLKVKADAAAIDPECKYGSAETTINIKVEGVAVNSSDVTFTYGGKVAQANTLKVADANLTDYEQVDGALYYNGEDYLPKIGIEVKDAKGNVLTEGTDYKVTVVKSANGTSITDNDKKVDSITDAGLYQIQVTSDTYSFTTSQVLNVLVNQLYVGDVRVAGLTTYEKDTGTATAPNIEKFGFLNYTGSEIDPVIEYKSDEKDGKGANVWKTLPANIFKATYEYKPTLDTVKATTNVKAVEDEGYYKMAIAKSKDDASKNYVFANSIVVDKTTDGYKVENNNTQGWIADFQVADKRVFSDVTTSDWFYNEVYAAADQGYVKGIAGTKLYAPNAGMTRGDVCVVLLRMAGGDLDYLADGSVNTNIAYNTKFSDVDPHVYYAKAIQWASQLGIVTGFDGTTEFAPEQTVSREQFATMLARYAKATGADITADASAIDGYADASAVESWATPFVAWAVEAGVMGQNTEVLAPGKDVSRAEVAAMAVRYQPKATTTDLVK